MEGIRGDQNDPDSPDNEAALILQQCLVRLKDVQQPQS